MKRIQDYKKWIFRGSRLLFVLANVVFPLFVHSQGNPVARYEIDAKRIGVNYTDKDALPRSREFIRLDSTYYVGYMYEGMYKSDRSSDYLGFRNAIPSLRKAFELLQHDYGKTLKTTFNSPEAYMQSMTKYVDFLQTANALRECYDNIEMPDSVMWVLNSYLSYNFPKDHLNAITIAAWTYHRNRFFTSKKFSFLKNSIAENEQAALELCYEALYRIDHPTSTLAFFPDPNEKLNVYHYLALLHNYSKNYDSSEYYYQTMARSGAVSWNNYGSLKHELGDFAVATEYYDRDRFKYGEKTLREPYYFMPILKVYSGKTKEAMDMCKEAISYAGSTPGFGWYNIAICRSYLYDGQLDSAEYALNKAAGFKELHIGTTLTQPQYDFTINLLKLQLIAKKIGLAKFENSGWWYSPKSLFRILLLKLQGIMLQYVLVNQLSANPERDRTVYDLFCGESTTTYDEAFYLLKDFSPSYFIKKYKTYQEKDKRANVQRYFELFQHKMEWENGDDSKAYTGFKDMIKEIRLDTSYEKLFLARLYEGLSKTSDEQDNVNDQNFYTQAMYDEYPQLVPFSGIHVRMKLITAGVDDKVTEEVIDDIKDCNVNWSNTVEGATIAAHVYFEKRGDKYEVTINTGTGKPIVVNEKMIFKSAQGAGREIALRLFGKSGARVFEPIDTGN